MKNGKIDKYLFEGGYCQATATGAYTDTFAFHYYNQDHLGNNREVVDPSGNVVQVTNYYPFGALYADASAVKGATLQQYKYNGKELDLMHGLNSYDYGARQDDPILGRWDRIDPLCEVDYNISPYAFCGGDPINRVDKDGRIWETVWDAGNLLWDVGSAIYNHATGSHEAAKANWSDAGLDLAATLIPGVPAGATKLFKAANKAADVAKVSDKATDAAKSIGKYSNIPNPINVKEGGKFTQRQKKAVLEENRKRNGGVIKSDQSGLVLDKPAKSKKGQKANMKQAEIDHIIPRSKGGTNSSSNAQVLSKEENLRKRDHY